ncbi:SwmB domain-containing protein, partial [Verminephrobacter aporrectodeae]
MPDNTSPAEIADRVTEEDSAKTKIWPMPPTGSTAADTTPPVVNTATVEGNQLVLTYTEAGALDPIALVLNAGFTVNTATAAITVTGVAMNITAKTVTLTLSRAVAVAETVTVNYTKPTFGQGVRDVAGNNAANFSNMAVTNNTQVDTTPPVLRIAVVNGNQLELMYTEANSLDGAALAGNAGFTVHSAAGRAITVTGAVVDATTKIVTLTLSRTVAHGETVSVSYVKPGAGNVVQDAAGNDAVNFSNWAVRNDTPEAAADTTPPEFHSATVRGNQLVIHFTDQSDLDDVSLVELVKNDNLYVRSDGFRPDGSPTWWKSVIGSAVVDATAKTVTLTLLHRMPHDRTVIVTYTKPGAGNVLQDVHGNQAASFDEKPVTNNTPTGADTTAPVLSSATVNGNQLVLTYIEAENLSGYLLEGNAGFTVSSAGGTAITVTGAVVDATHNTVTLTLSRAVAYRETVTLSHTMAGVEDVAGNDTANFSNRDVTNITPAPPDTTAPEFHSAAVTGNQLVLTYAEANSLDAAALTGNAGFTVNTAAGATAITVSSAVVNATANTVTLTLSRAVTHGETVTVSYTRPESGNWVRDAAGNNAVNFISSQAVTNNTPAPSALNVEITLADSALTAGETTTVTFTFTRPVNGFDIPDLSCTNGTLSAPVANAQRTVWTATFTPTANVNAPANTINVVLTGVTDDAGNAGVGEASSPNYTVDTRSAADTTAPVFSSATVTGNQLVLTYTEANTLDGAALTGNAGFTVNTAAGATAITVSSAVVNATAKTVTLTLSRAVAATETVTVSYTKPESGAVVQDAAGNDAVSFSDRAVTNNTSSATIPDPDTLTTIASVECSDLVLSANETCTYTIVFTRAVDPLTFSLADLKTVRPGTYEVITNKGELSNLRTTDGNITWKFDLKAPDSGNSTDNLILLYIEDVTDKEGRRCGGGTLSGANRDGRYPFTTHTYTIDTTAPEINTATVNGNQLVLTYTEANTLDGAALAGNAGYAVNNAAGTAAITVSSAVVNATTKTVTLTLSRAVANTETVTVSYTKPESGAVVQDAAGNDAVNFSSQAVTNSTPGTTPGADTTAPEINTAVVTGDKLVLTYREAGTLDATALVGNAGFTVNTAAGTTAITVTGVAVHITDKTVTLTLSRAVAAT